MFGVSGDTNSLPQDKQSSLNPAESPDANGGQNDVGFNLPCIETAQDNGEAALEQLEEIINQPAALEHLERIIQQPANNQSPDLLLAQYCAEIELELQSTGYPPSMEDRLGLDTIKYCQ